MRTIAVARITMPKSVVRLSAGREDMREETQALCFVAGANSIFYGPKLLYQSQLALRLHGFGGRLETRSFSAPLHSTSELLRTLSRVAASKPTSWLFVRSDLLRHLVFTLGP